MYKVSDLSVNEIITRLSNSELGLLLLEADETWEDEVGLSVSEHPIVYHVFSLLYSQQLEEISSNLIKTRWMAIQNVFARWSEAGYNKWHAKDPFKSKTFKKYLDEIGFIKADYMFLLIK